MDDMDEKRYLAGQIKKCRDKMNLARLLDCGVLAAAVGGVLGMLCELASLLWPFYHAHLAAGLCFAAGALAGAGYAIYRRADMRRAAMRLDSFGLKERMLTAYELMDVKAGDKMEMEMAGLQRRDAILHYNRARERIKIPLLPDKRHILALLLSAAVVAGLGLLPSAVREQAALRHQVQKAAQEELEKLEGLMDALGNVDVESLTDEQRAQLRELAEAMQRSREELARADTWESLGSAMDRLDYKYEQAAQELGSLASQMADPGGAGVASAQALAQAAMSPERLQQSSQATVSPGQSGLSPGQAGGSQDGEAGSQGEGSASDSRASGSGEGDNSGQGGGSGSENGNGDGSGEGSGTGNGEGSGDGGNGRGTGSSSAAHDYVSIPNGIADDPSLTGSLDQGQDSNYYRQQNGLAWEGEHVDYNSVIGQYTDSAYEGISSGRYPSGMESVIRDYFESLNK